MTGDAYKVNYQSPAHNLMHGDLQGKTNKAAVTVMVDMVQRQLAFSINGGPSVLATKAGGLPARVRPLSSTCLACYRPLRGATPGVA